MGKMMNLFQSAVETVKQQHEDKKRREAADAAWVREQPASKVICDYFYAFFDKDQPGYRFIKENHQTLTLSVKEDGVELHWAGNHGPAQSLREAKAIGEGDKRLIPFAEAYQWRGGFSGYARLDTRAKQAALREMILQKIRSHPHIKYNEYTCNIGVKLFH